MEIRRATDADWDAIWPIFQEVVEAGDSFYYSPETNEADARAIWMSPAAATYVAVEDGAVVGSYLIKPNHPGLGSHVANAAYMVKAGSSGRGVGRAMGEHSLDEARKAGYLAMQFNCVVSTNERAIGLWKSLGFHVVGVLPKAFRHKDCRLIDAYVMYRLLD